MRLLQDRQQHTPEEMLDPRVYLRLLVLQILLSIGLLWVLAAVIVERTL
jgi:hypothetical protein